MPAQGLDNLSLIIAAANDNNPTIQSIPNGQSQVSPNVFLFNSRFTRIYITTGKKRLS